MFDDVQRVIEPYSEPQVACRDFDPRGADIARQIVGLISRHLPTFRAEHIGSTAVPGCGGSGIVDLLATGPESELENATLLLTRLGFQQGGEAVIPAAPPAFRGTLTDNGQPYLLNVYVLPGGAAEIDSIRFLRSCLRADAELAKAYVGQKKAIVKSGVTNRADYCRQKGEFLKMVLG